MGIGTPVALLVGMLLVLGSVGLFFFDKIRPAYARDSDKVYAAFILITGLVTLVNWGMDAGPSFLMFLMSGMLTTLLIESIRNREPLVVDPMPPSNRRPPSPRYDERPPVRRGYRAEIDRDAYRERPPVDLPARRQANQARMNPAQENAWRNDYADNGVMDSRGRQPYEEYRGPAGRLQPSRANGPEDGRYTNSGGNRNGRYDEPLPARPPSNNRPSDRPPERFPERPPERPPERFPENARNNGPNGPNGGIPADFQARPPERRPEDRPANGERALNVRPYSEAPKLDLAQDSYRPDETRSPERDRDRDRDKGPDVEPFVS